MRSPPRQDQSRLHRKHFELPEAPDTFQTMRDVVSRDPSLNSAASTSPDVLRGMFIGAPVILYGGGLLVRNEHARANRGLLAGEAMLDAYVADVGIKYVTVRERTYVNNARGYFFSGDAVSDLSFVSGRSVAETAVVKTPE